MDYTEEEMRAQISVGLTQDRNPDQLASVLRKSEELGIDPGAVEQLDNTMLTPRFEAKGHRAETLRFLGRDPYVAGLLRNDADKMDEINAGVSGGSDPASPGGYAVTSSSDIREAVGSYLAQRYGARSMPSGSGDIRRNSFPTLRSGDMSGRRTGRFFTTESR